MYSSEDERADTPFSDEDWITEEDIYKYKNFCKYCSKTIQSWDKVEYCSEHQEHQQVCQVSNCLRRDIFRGYCPNHEHKCVKYQCEARVISHRDVCENHLDYHRCDFWTSPALAYRNCKDYFCWKELIINHAKETGRGLVVNEQGVLPS